MDRDTMIAQIAARLRIPTNAVRLTIELFEGMTGEAKHVGGGWYELPNGDRVRGKAKAQAALLEQAAA